VNQLRGVDDLRQALLDQVRLRGDLGTFMGDFVANLNEMEFPVGLSF
jgi:hypothetical protein